MNGAERICATLLELGVRHVFGLPGTQNVALYEALRRCELRSVVASNETAAAFMASGYARASGRVGVLTTIPGPGFVFALAGVVEAHHDSVPLLWLAMRTRDSGRAFQLQRIDQTAMARPVVKSCVLVEEPGDLANALRRAMAEAVSGEPGPVLVEIAADVLDCLTAPAGEASTPPVNAPFDSAQLLELIRAAARPIIYAGQGAQGASDSVRRLAEALRAPVLFTASGRGVLADSDPLAFVKDFSFSIGEVVPALIERADLVIALGCKFTHNGSGGGRLDLPAEKLVRVDSSAAVLAANYPARFAVHDRVENVLSAFAAAALPRSQWTTYELDSFRQRLTQENARPVAHEPVLKDGERMPIQAFFQSLAAAIGARSIYTTDAGLHQAVTRRYATVAQPRALLCPSDFQSMGFGLPAGIGAALSRPDSCAVACIGDGGLALSAGELLTAMREAVDLVVVVFNDGYLNLIRRQQINAFGREFGIQVESPDYALLAQAIRCSYFRVGGDLDALALRVAETPGLRLVELRLTDTASFWRQHAMCIVRETIRPAVPDSLVRILKRAFGG